jgi:NAD(P)-dependent dehydrogenase (short-subunit alcohol dehydrogenase family)
MNHEMATKPGQIVAMITGATSGIGRAVAKRFMTRSGVVIVGRDQSALESATEIKRQPVSLSLAADVTIDDDMRKAFDSALDKTGHLDVLVNAAVTYRRAPLKTRLSPSGCHDECQSAFSVQSDAIGDAHDPDQRKHREYFECDRPAFVPGVLAYCVSRRGRSVNRCAALSWLPKVYA